MGDRSGEFNVPHPLPANDRTSDFHAAFFADNVLIANAPVFPAITLVVFLRAENFLVEKPSALATPGAVVDRLRLGHFAVRPLLDLLRRGELELYLIEFGCV